MYNQVKMIYDRQKIKMRKMMKITEKIHSSREISHPQPCDFPKTWEPQDFLL